jgi:hypothetical protein
MTCDALLLSYKILHNSLQNSTIICYDPHCCAKFSVLGCSLDAQHTLYTSGTPMGKSLGLLSSVNVTVKEVSKL